MGKSSQMGTLIHAPSEKTPSLCQGGRYKNVKKEEQLETCEGQDDEKEIFLGCTQRECKPNLKNMFESLISAGTVEQLPGWERSTADMIDWSQDMQ